MNKNFAIFDMDGTLIDSMRFWDNLIYEYFKIKSIDTVSEDLITKIKSLTLSESSKLIQKLFNIKEDPNLEMTKIINEHYKKDIPLKKGIKPYLEKMKSKNVKMAVASTTDKLLMDECLIRLGIMEFFEFTISCETIKQGKDKPDIYFYCAEEFKKNPEDIAVYEDALYALETASQSGFYTIGVFDKSSSCDWIKIKEISDETIKDWRDLI